ncbi:class I lanthipeptide [uncultured Kordia sp.]|uniref:class I lanthipeptide n=1 Tax=uncultured Kordia sp. TaxID=507699 RepID=UPI002611527B|nr:class I lanthipeptide [uncultured Kordia sp.]
MKKKNLIKKLQFKKTQVSNLSETKIIGGLADTRPILTARCTEFRTCNEITIATCLTDECHTARCTNLCTNWCTI